MVILAGMMRDLTYGEIVSYDMDKNCEVIGKKHQKGKNITFKTKTMQDFELGIITLTFVLLVNILVKKTLIYILRK